jgi:hypothetical protein
MEKNQKNIDKANENYWNSWGAKMASQSLPAVKAEQAAAEKRYREAQAGLTSKFPSTDGMAPKDKKFIESAQAKVMDEYYAASKGLTAADKKLTDVTKASKTIYGKKGGKK